VSVAPETPESYPRCSTGCCAAALNVMASDPRVVRHFAMVFNRPPERIYFSAFWVRIAAFASPQTMPWSGWSAATDTRVWSCPADPSPPNRPRTLRGSDRVHRLSLPGPRLLLLCSVFNLYLRAGNFIWIDGINYRGSRHVDKAVTDITERKQCDCSVLQSERAGSAHNVSAARRCHAMCSASSLALSHAGIVIDAATRGRVVGHSWRVTMRRRRPGAA
jgi:hypothetical protein